jgi:hypothetical protein
MAKLFFGILMVGLAVVVLATWLGHRADERPEHPSRPEQNDSSSEELAELLYWVGGGIMAVGSIGLIFCGVHRSALIGRPGY